MYFSSARRIRRACLMVGLWGSAALLLTGCTPNGWYSTPPTIYPITFTTQPMSQVVPPGETATFTAIATSSQPLTYQWTENGIVIPGATSTSYTTPPVTLVANGSTLIGTFALRAMNDSSVGFNVVSSQSATLEIGPRMPKPGDLRYLLFQQVPSSDLGADSPLSGPSTWASNALGSPLSMGSSVDCDGHYLGASWSSTSQFLITPSPYSMYYYEQGYPSFASDLQSLSTPNVVLTSLDLEPECSVYAVSWVQTTQSDGFDYRLDPVIPPGTGQQSQIQAQAALDGAQSRIVTAVSFDASGSANLISYGWQGDTTTVYEAQTTLVPPGSNVTAAVAAAANTLANQGYFISAFGGNDTEGYILVGMRVQGDSYPRPIQMQTFTLGTSGTTPATNPTIANYTVVAWLQELGNDVIILEQ
jgi:hypothetical protein